MPNPRGSDTDGQRLLEDAEAGPQSQETSRDGQTFSFATEKPSDTPFAPLKMTPGVAALYPLSLLEVQTPCLKMHQ